MSAILIIAPMLAPMAAAVGVDPIHMGIIFIVNLEIGYLTPPVGLNLFVSSTLFKESIGFVVRAVVPTLGIMLVALAIVSYVPSLSTGLVMALRTEAKAPELTPVMGVKPTEPAPTEPGEKSLADLMRANKEAVDGGEAAAPEKSLQDLMREAKEKKGDDVPALETDAGPEGTVPAPVREKSLQELMQESKQKTP